MARHRLIPTFGLSVLFLFSGLLSAGVDRWTPLGPDGGAVTALAAPSGVAGLVFAGTETAGVFVSRDGGTSWQPARSGLPSGQRIRFVTAGGRNGQLLFAVTNAAVYASEDGGRSWKPRRLPRQVYGNDEPNTGIVSFAASPDARTLFFGYRSPGSEEMVFRSTDGGRSWKRIDTRFGDVLSKLGPIAVSPSAPSTVYTAIPDSRGLILRSIDNGGTWSVKGSFAGAVHPDLKLVVDLRDEHVLYAAYGDTVARSTSGGSNWAQLAQVDPTLDDSTLYAADLAIDPSEPSTLYFALNRSVPGYSGWYGGGIFRYEGRIYRTTDGGASWTQVTVSDPVAAIRVDSVQPRRIYAGVSRIGILRSMDRGSRWNKSNRGLMAASLCAVAPDPFTRDLLYISAGVCEQTFEVLADNDDLGFLKGDAARNWTNLSSDLRNPIRVLEAYAIVPDPQVEGTLYAATGHGLFKSTNGGGQWESLQSGLESILEAVLSVTIDPADSQTLYAAGFKLGYPSCGGHCPLEPVYASAKSTDGGITWTKLQPTALVEMGITIDPQDPRVLYAPDGLGNLLKSTDRGATWTTLPVRGIDLELPIFSRLVIDPAAPQTLYAIASSLYSDQSALIKSTDGGVTWVREEQGLPLGTEIRDLAIDPERTATLYAATNRGVFVSDDAGAHWLSLPKKGLTNRDVVRVSLDPFDPATIYAGTRGDGGLFVLTRSVRPAA
ncbi:MAG TPA: hypothetical protein VKM72_18610 [Thermoanaerobaculia bacterium]|nr:hypothetical protein [Thermoanaerobaculia bacterium]